MKKMIPIIVLLLILGCKSDDDNNDNQVICAEEAIIGLSIQVRDASTNGIILNSIEVTATDGDYTEDLVFQFDTWFGAVEREGSYVITVIASGYDNLTSDTIVVGKTDDDCHVITEVREFRLNPN